MSEQRQDYEHRQMARRTDDAVRRTERRREARHALRRIARDQGVQWLLREAQVIAVWSPDPAN